jgi:hydrogenase expression/formation protein HypE
MNKARSGYGRGKAGKDFLERIILPRLGSRNRIKDLLVGPGTGLDNAVIRLGDGKVLVGKTDPITWIPELGPRDSAWLSIHQIASDFVTSGIVPEYAFFDFNLPPKVTDREFQEYWDSLDAEMRKLGITVAGGHTGRYEGSDFTVVGGATLIGVGDKKQYLAPSMAKVGDAIVVTKGAAIECTAILAKTFPKTVAQKLGRSVLEKAQKYFPLISVVKEALVATSKIGKAGGITSMHDIEEGGVLSAVCEVAIASNNGFSVSKSKIPLSEESREICKLFGIHDPLAAIGGGSLILTVSPEKAQKLVDVLVRGGVGALVVGEIERKRNGFKVVDDSGRKVKYPIADPYWRAFWRASRAGWN